MIHIRDFSIKKRLLFSNFFMIIIPVIFMALLSALVFLSLQFGNLNRSTILSFLWPESGPTLSTQFELTRFRVRADQFKKKSKDLVDSAHHLEALGCRVVIVGKQGAIIYQTEDTQGMETLSQALSEAPSGRGSISWGEKGLAFHYFSDESGVRLAVIGEGPLVVDGELIDISSKALLKKSFYVVCGLVTLLILIIGWKLSRYLGRQIIEPLQVLQVTASHIAQGDLDTPVPVDSEDEIGMTMMAFELTRRQLKMARETRDRYERNRKEMIAGISHDLSTPLTKIEGYACGLRDGIADTPEKKDHYFRMIIDTARHMGNLVQSLFLFSKLDLGRMEYHMEKVPLKAYLEDYVEEQSEHFKSQGLLLKVEAPREECVVLLDRIQFSRIVTNLLSNSIKYKTADLGHVVMSLSVPRKQWVQLAFSDDGPGVAPSDLSHLFESFYRTDKARTNPAKGSGLGLAVVRELVKGMKGIIWAENETPHGLKIVMEFPLAKEEA